MLGPLVCNNRECFCPIHPLRWLESRPLSIRQPAVYGTSVSGCSMFSRSSTSSNALSNVFGYEKPLSGVEVPVQCIRCIAEVPKTSVASKVLSLIHDGKELVVAFIFPAARLCHGFGHPRSSAPALFGSLMQVAVLQVISALGQKLSGLLAIVGHDGIVSVVGFHWNGLAHALPTYPR